MDNMVNMLEKYANNLEEIVSQRTSELLEEKKKTDRLLYSMLPRYSSKICQKKDYTTHFDLAVFGICK